MSNHPTENQLSRKGTPPVTRGDRRLKVAVVGAGRMGRHHLTAIQRLEQYALLVGVADADTTFAKAVGEDLGIPWFDDVTSLLEAARPDVVHVTTSSQHGPIARAALRAGAHVYVEKPFSETADEARELLAVAAEQERRVCAGHQLLFEAPTLRAQELLPRIGTIQHVESYFAFRQATRQDGRPPLTPDAQLMDILPHPACLLVHFLGRAAPNTPLTISAVRADPRGVAHILCSAGDATGSLTATLRGRPVDSFVRVIGDRGTLTLDYVRGITLAAVGEGSTIDKIVEPYQRGAGLIAGTTGSLLGRVVHRQRAYSGLVEGFEAFYRHLLEGAEAPMSGDEILRTVELCDRVSRELAAAPVVEAAGPELGEATVAVTGGTGLLGRRVVEAVIENGEVPLILSRRPPAPGCANPGAHYLETDLGSEDRIPLPKSVRAVIHCAAETSGGWDAHQRNSIDATRNLLDAMQHADIPRLVHVSSVAVIDLEAGQPLSEASDLAPRPRERGAYVWGKLESERIVAEATDTHGIDSRIVRLGPIVDWSDLSPPGKLGRQLGPLFLAMGSPRSTMAVSGLESTARLLAWSIDRFEDLPDVLHCLDPEPTTRETLVRELRAARPGTRVVWLPWPILRVLSGMAGLLQKLIRPGQPPLDVYSAFEAPRFDVGQVRALGGAWSPDSPTASG